MRTTYVRDPISGQFVVKGSKEDSVRYYVQPDIEPFVSPIDQRIVTGRAALRKHNSEHGVVNYNEFGDSYFERKAAERVKVRQGDFDHKGRTRDIVEAFNRLEEQQRRR